jgi:hypothetical protein
MHPNKHIREALKYAAENGWLFSKSHGHPFGRIKCGFGHRRCQLSIWSTPRNPEAHAKAIRRVVDACPGVPYEDP